MTATTDREWLEWLADDTAGELKPEERARLRTIAATLPPPYSPQPPTVEGWYWYRDNIGSEGPKRVYKFDGMNDLYVVSSGPFRDLTVAEYRGEWSGPIPQPPK